MFAMGGREVVKVDGDNDVGEVGLGQRINDGVGRR